jgi:hypothetical protein
VVFSLWLYYEEATLRRLAVADVDTVDKYRNFKNIGIRYLIFRIPKISKIRAKQGEHVVSVSRRKFMNSLMNCRTNWLVNSKSF